MVKLVLPLKLYKLIFYIKDYVCMCCHAVYFVVNINWAYFFLTEKLQDIMHEYRTKYMWWSARRPKVQLSSFEVLPVWLYGKSKFLDFMLVWLWYFLWCLAIGVLLVSVTNGENFKNFFIHSKQYFCVSFRREVSNDITIENFLIGFTHGFCQKTVLCKEWIKLKVTQQEIHKKEPKFLFLFVTFFGCFSLNQWVFKFAWVRYLKVVVLCEVIPKNKILNLSLWNAFKFIGNLY